MKHPLHAPLTFAGALALAGLPCALPQTAARFGRSVSSADVNGDGYTDVVVGEPGHDGNLVDEGRMLVYHGSPSGPANAPSWTRRGMQRGAHFGFSVAGLGDVNGDGYEDVAVGAPDYDAPRPALTAGPGAAQLVTFRGSGAFAVFLGSPAGLSLAPALFHPGIQHEEHVGAAVARAGDVNDDGYDDVLVGATGTLSGVGAAFLFLGSASGPEPLPDWIAQPTFMEQGSGYGSVLTGGADVNGDGYDDVAVGMPNGGVGQRGEAIVYHGSASGLTPFGAWSLPSNPNGDGPLDNLNSAWGTAIALGDVNGDGFAELAVSDPYYDGDTGHGSGQQYDTGVVFLFPGSSTGLGTEWVVRSTGAVTAPFGVGLALAIVPDLNGDGLRETVMDALGGTRIRYGDAGAGYWGSSSSIGAPLFGGAFGQSLSTAGDIDGDGWFDLLASDPLVDFDIPDEGAVFAYRGKTGGPAASPDWTVIAP